MTDNSATPPKSRLVTDLKQLRYNDRQYHPSNRSIANLNGEEIRLRAKTCEVFEVLARHSNSVVSRDRLISEVWGDVIVTDDSLNQSIREIRKALGDKDRKVLETIHRHGYMLHATELPLPAGATRSTIPTSEQTRLLLPVVATGLLVLGGIYLWVSNSTDKADSGIGLEHQDSVNAQNAANTPSYRDNLTVWVNTSIDMNVDHNERLTKTVITALSRYSNIDPTPIKAEAHDYELQLSWLDDGGGLVNVQLHHHASGELVIAENMVRDKAEPKGIANLGARIAALVGSPAGGAIGHHLLKISRNKPVKLLTRPECLAHGYGCTSCSGEFDTITPRAVQCLAVLLEKNSQDPDAWALQSTVFSRQYLWGSSLQEPLRSDKSKRDHLKAKAVEAATRAEALAKGNNPSVYWGMVHAYIASCDVEKIQTAVDHALRINPDDPNMLAAYGNFLAYPGAWDEGKALIERAWKLEPLFFQKWWYMGLAKWHYRKGEYQQAYDLFGKSFNERNWLSHLQLAYTLPHLGRINEAKKALRDFMRVAPSMTREHIYEFYRSYCFDDSFLRRIKEAFDLIDMPSRGSGDDFDNILPLRAAVEKIGDRMVEYVDVGEGTPVVFVHGSMSDFRTWGYMLLPMSERYRFLSPTLRYFGTLDWPDGEHQFDINVDVQDIINFIEHKALGPVYLVGWSRSGAITSALARERPDLVRGIINYEPTTYELLYEKNNPDIPSEDQWPDFSEVSRLAESGDLEAAVKLYFEKALERGSGEFEIEPTVLQQVVLDNARTVPLIFSEPAADQPYVDCKFIGDIELPGLVLYGSRTNAAWQYISRRYADCLTNGQIKPVRNANHDGPISQPQQIAEYIHEFIKSTESEY